MFVPKNSEKEYVQPISREPVATGNNQFDWNFFLNRWTFSNEISQNKFEFGDSLGTKLETCSQESENLWMWSWWVCHGSKVQDWFSSRLELSVCVCVCVCIPVPEIVPESLVQTKAPKKQLEDFIMVSVPSAMNTTKVRYRVCFFFCTWFLMVFFNPLLKTLDTNLLQGVVLIMGFVF
jgi:hypothetical protein